MGPHRHANASCYVFRSSSGLLVLPSIDGRVRLLPAFQHEERRKPGAKQQPAILFGFSSKGGAAVPSPPSLGNISPVCLAAPSLMPFMLHLPEQHVLPSLSRLNSASYRAGLSIELSSWLIKQRQPLHHIQICKSLAKHGCTGRILVQNAAHAIPRRASRSLALRLACLVASFVRV